MTKFLLIFFNIYIICSVLFCPVPSHPVPSRLRTKRYPNFNTLSSFPREMVIFLQKQLISLGTRHISNFYLDWVTVDFSVRMDKVHEGFHFSFAVLLFCFCHFTCVSFCESRTQNEESSGSEVKASLLFGCWTYYFTAPSSLKASVDSWLQSLFSQQLPK
ncbi:hypothetical protein DVH24_014231 [Malus domestica]|uniref:Uncharacterized protein n=1 Tax=Malus domestica TaxID=3750 RepID=A0A498JFN2_MALDO|nr:hypothetical protein DVH24_014231 [Malus domestica]